MDRDELIEVLRRARERAWERRAEDQYKGLVESFKDQIDPEAKQKREILEREGM